MIIDLIDTIIAPSHSMEAESVKLEKRQFVENRAESGVVAGVAIMLTCCSLPCAGEAGSLHDGCGWRLAMSCVLLLWMRTTDIEQCVMRKMTRNAPAVQGMATVATRTNTCY
jgi:hypothetical protein